MVIMLNLQVALGSMVILTISILSIQEHHIPFHLFMSSSISLISSLQFFWEYRCFISLGRFIPRYFILFDVMVNEIVSLISHFDISLIVYRNVTGFCILDLHPVTLSN